MSTPYLQKKAKFASLLTLYGRHVVTDILQDHSLQIYKLHLAKSNKTDSWLTRTLDLARQRKIKVQWHEKRALSHISKNAKQDQGVAIDIESPNYASADTLTRRLPAAFRLLALDGIHNPQNLGMIIRSAAAGNIDGILIPQKNSAKISPLVMKASAGTLFKIPLYYCESLYPVLQQWQQQAALYQLSSHAQANLFERPHCAREIFILGNEHQGIDPQLQQLASQSLQIPMQRGVESLNVAVTAALIAFL